MDVEDRAHKRQERDGVADDPNSERSFFRFRRSALDRIAGDRELMLRQAEQRAREAEERAGRMEEELRRSSNGGAPNGAAPPQPEGSPRAALARRVADTPGLSSLPPEQLEALLGAVVSAAEQAARDLAGGAGSPGDGPVGDARRALGNVRREVQELPDRLADALKPLAEAVREADAGLAELEGREGPEGGEAR